MGWLAVLPSLRPCGVAPECRRFCRAGAAAKAGGVGESAGESTVIRALVVGRLGAAACVSEPRFAPAVCGAVAAVVAASPPADAVADEAVAAAAARLRVS